MKVLISLRLYPDACGVMFFECWVLSRASWFWIYVILMPGKGLSSRLCSIYGLKQALRSWHNHLVPHIKSLGFEQNPADACVTRLIESGSISIVTVVHVDDIFAWELKSKWDQFCEDLNRLVTINNLGDLRWYACCRFSRDWNAGTVTSFR